MEEWGTGGRDGWTHGRTRQRTNNQQEMAAAICRHCGKKRPHETRKVKLSRRCSSLPSPFLSYGQNDCFRQAPPRRSEAALAAAACFLLCARFSPSLPNSRLPLRFDYVCLSPQPRRRGGRRNEDDNGQFKPLFILRRNSRSRRAARMSPF